jgi:hypothetical protein
MTAIFEIDIVTGELQETTLSINQNAIIVKSTGRIAQL